MYELANTNQNVERKEIHMKTKLTTKDLITAGAFGAIYLVLLTVLSSVLTIVPILFLATPLIAGIILGTVYMLYGHQGAAAPVQSWCWRSWWG